MTRVLCIAAFLAVILFASGRPHDDPLDPVTRAGAALIIRTALNQSTVFDRLAYICDTFGPRFSGSDNLERAIDHVIQVAEADGLKVTQEPTMIPRWVRGRESARLVAPSPRIKV